MEIQSQPMTESLPLPINNDKCCSFKELFFHPIRFCGRQWMWMNDNDGRISQIALKVLAFPFLICCTILAGVMAIIGALAFSADNIPSSIKRHPRGDIQLLRRDLSNAQVEEKIRTQLATAGYSCSVHVESLERTVNPDYYPEYIHRYVTLTDPSSTSCPRFWKVIKNHFWNKNVPSLNNLYSCIGGIEKNEDLDTLKEVLALHKEVTFSISFDLAYVKTELGRKN